MSFSPLCCGCHPRGRRAASDQGRGSAGAGRTEKTDRAERTKPVRSAQPSTGQERRGPPEGGQAPAIPPGTPARAALSRVPRCRRLPTGSRGKGLQAQRDTRRMHAAPCGSTRWGPRTTGAAPTQACARSHRKTAPPPRRPDQDRRESWAGQDMVLGQNGRKADCEVTAECDSEVASTGIWGVGVEPSRRILVCGRGPCGAGAEPQTGPRHRPKGSGTQP